MKTVKASTILVGLILTLTLASCGPTYVRTGYDPGYGYYGAAPYAYRRPAPIIVRPPRVVYRSYPRYYRSGPPAYGRRYNAPGHRRGHW